MTDGGEGSEVPIEIRHYRPGDEARILEAFHKVFPWARRSLPEWNWEFRDCPGGLHCFLGVLEDGRVVSQFTGIPRRVKVGEGERCFAEIVDSLSDPEFRQGLKKPGLFATTVYRYVDHYGRPDRETIMYGLPNPPAYRIGSRLLGYTHLHHVEALTRDLEAAAAGAAVGASQALAGGTWSVIDTFPADTDELWERVRGEYDVAVIRDRVYLEWRYVGRPGVAYRTFALRETGGRLLALVVMRDGWLEKESGKRVSAMADWLVDRRHPLVRALPGLLEEAAHAAGSTQIQFVFRPQSDEWRHFAEVGYRPEPTQFRLVGRTYDADHVPLDRLKDRWFFTLGDFDVI